MKKKTTATKTVEKPEEVKKINTVASTKESADSMEPVKEVEKVTTPVKTEKKETAVVPAKTMTEPKTTVAKKTTAEPKTDATKKTTAKKAATKTTKATTKTEKVVACDCYVQFGGNEVSMEAVKERVKADYVAAGHRESSIKEMKIYVKPEDNRAYYVINGKHSASVMLL